MKITFEEILADNEWIHVELLNSLPGEVVTKAQLDRFYDVKLLVNGIELEPVIYNKLISGIDDYIDSQAKALMKEKLDELDSRVRDLDTIISEAKEKIREQFNIED